MSVSLNITPNSSANFNGAVKKSLEDFIPNWTVQDNQHAISVSDTAGKFLEWTVSGSAHVVNEVDASTGVRTSITVDGATPSVTSSNTYGYQAVRIANGQFVVFIPNSASLAEMKVQVFTKSGDTLTYVKEIQVGSTGLPIADYDDIKMAGNEVDNLVYFLNTQSRATYSLDIVSETLSASLGTLTYFPTLDTSNQTMFFRTGNYLVHASQSDGSPVYCRLNKFDIATNTWSYIHDEQQVYYYSTAKAVYDPNDSSVFYLVASSGNNPITIVRDMVATLYPTAQFSINSETSGHYSVREYPTMKLDDFENSYGVFDLFDRIQKVAVSQAGDLLVGLLELTGSGAVLGYEHIFLDSYVSSMVVPAISAPAIRNADGDIVSIPISFADFNFRNQGINIPFSADTTVYDNILYGSVDVGAPRSVIYRQDS